MTVVVTRMPGGVAQVFNPDTGKITYKCKSEKGAVVEIEALGGVARFAGPGSSAVVCGPSVKLDGCEVVREGQEGYAEAKAEAGRRRAEFADMRASELRSCGAD